MVKDILVPLQQEKKSRLFLAQTTLALSFVLFFIKYWSYSITQSQALLSDAMETIVNVIVSGLSLWAIYWAAQPADEGHPYGHGKAEHLSAASEGGLIFAAALFIFASSLRSFFEPVSLKQLDLGMGISLAAGAINGLMGWLLVYRGRQLKSVAIRASGYHLLSDLMTTLGVLAGLLLVRWTQILWIDSLLAMLVAFHLLFTGVKIIQRSMSSLMDAVDRQSVERFNKIINESRPPWVIQLHHLRMIISGDYHHIDAHVVMPEYWDIKKSHDAVFEYEKHVFKKYQGHGELHFHIDPCQRAYCASCADASCPIRQETFVQQHPITVDEMLAFEEPNERTTT